MTSPIKLIVCDLDGTLLNSNHQMSQRSETALKAAIDRGVQVVIATGKTFVSAEAIIRRLNLTTPGIYNQGLVICEPDGTISYQRTLDSALARRVWRFGEQRGFSLAAYSGTRIMVRALNAEICQLAHKYHEPTPEAVEDIHEYVGTISIHKLLVITDGEVERIDVLRKQLEGQMNGDGQVIQALPDMVEIIPPGASKAEALDVLLARLEIAPEQVMALGDGENDIPMLRMAGIGVAMGNAQQMVRDAADYITGTNDADGVADAVEQFVLAQINGGQIR